MLETPAPQELTDDKDPKRERFRAALHCPVAYQVIEDGKPTGPSAPAVTVNLNTTGALIRAEQHHALDTLIRLDITVPWTKAPLRAHGRVIRVQEEVRGKSYLLGIHFDETDSEKPLDFLSRLEAQDFQQLLEDLLKAGGSDLHLTTGNPPMARIQSRLVPLKGPVFQPGEIGAFLYSIMTEEQAEAFEKKKELDFAYALTLEKRFRVNVHRQRGQTEAAIRVVPSQVGNWKELALPPIVEQWARKPDGLILIAGPTGSGKTTTLNTLVRMINDQREGVVICLERPIEYVHTNKKSIIKQREIGNDTVSYAEAVRQAMRQDPDVIVVGEIEDQETVLAVLNAAQAGNLVFASVHGSNTEGAIDRLINLCSADQRQQVTFQLSTCLHGIMTQHLFPREQGQMSGAGSGLVLATEVFVMTEAAQNHIRTNNLVQLRSAIETGVGLKMHTLESSIKQLSDKGIISPAIADRYLYGGKRGRD